jgi:hypothetical protein
VAPAAVKSATGSSIGDLIIVGLFSTGTVAVIANIAGSYLKRKRRTLGEVEDGQREVTLTGQSPADQLRLLHMVMAEDDDDDHMRADG